MADNSNDIDMVIPEDIPHDLPQNREIILASASKIRAALLRNSGLSFDIKLSRIDEEMVKASLQAEAAKPRDIADVLAEHKARKVSATAPHALVIGSDQVLEFNGAILSKPLSKADLMDQLQQMRGAAHKLHSAAVIYDGAKPVWRSTQSVTLHMHQLSDAYLENYIARNWDEIRHCVGGYQIEGEGIRFFSRIQGDYFTILGIPLLDVLNYLRQTGVISG